MITPLLTRSFLVLIEKLLKLIRFLKFFFVSKRSGSKLKFHKKQSIYLMASYDFKFIIYLLCNNFASALKLIYQFLVLVCTFAAKTENLTENPSAVIFSK